MSELETEIQDGIQEAKDYTDQVASNLEVDISADVTAECNTYTDQQISIAVTNCNATAVAAAEAAGAAAVIEANAYALSINTTTTEYVNNEINAIAGDMIEEDTYDYDSGYRLAIHPFVRLVEGEDTADYVEFETGNEGLVDGDGKYC
ncbi:hypothetical protein QTN25_006297 [Entamoeba marina]